MEELSARGNRVILITSDSLKNKNWPWHAISDVYYMSEEKPSVWNLKHLEQGFSFLLQKTKVDAVIALDDYDVEKAAMIRESFRIPGMGQTTHRYFRDKLAMRQKAKDCGIEVPEFTAIFNDETVNEFADRIPAPWVLKPRSEASATGIKKINSKEVLWDAIKKLGEERHLFLLESFKPGDVYHVDSLTYNGQIVFTSASMYLAPPMQVSHDGGVFRTRTLERSSEDFRKLEALNRQLLTDFGLKNGANHTEFIKGKEDGKWYFLETSSRVGGAHIPDLVEASTGINIWREWAKMEDDMLHGNKYEIGQPSDYAAGLLVALANSKNPDYSLMEQEDVVKFLPIDNHVGVVYRCSTAQQLLDRLNAATEQVQQNFLSVIPPKDKPSA